MRGRRVVAVCVGLWIVGCGAPSHNGADAQFAATMVPHHELGVRMADTAVARADHVLVRRLAFKMSSYQQAELRSLIAWRSKWPSDADLTHVHGMLTAAEESELSSLSGTEFDRNWLTEMIRHHEGAVEMAQAEQAAGANAEARAVAARIITLQEEQIAEMKGLLTALTT
jgi:uncharacterized protein (DUF305 family)